ncbi:MAG: helix-turn-helix domain-containing protein [Nevskiaceae bacterium]|jgi:AraC-like DNA-binding protein|nr:helix-turn-helix domain-containing protein [Nevskiaceae bacterium]
MTRPVLVISRSPDSVALDLRHLDAAQRRTAWTRVAEKLFPGMEIQGAAAPPAAGWLRGAALGAGHIWTILSPPLRANFLPSQSGEFTPCHSLMLQRNGSTLARQGDHITCLRSNQLCLIDEAQPFELEVVQGLSEFTFLRIPTPLLPPPSNGTRRRTATPFDETDAGTALLTAMLLKLADRADELDGSQGERALTAIALLLDLPRQEAAPPARDASHRSRAAVSWIDARLADPALSAEAVAHAQGISRRRLDSVLVTELGKPAAELIWHRRLLRAADDLCDPRRIAQSITQIALGVGFEHPAHFTRAFKRQYHCTPRDWRAQGAQATQPPKS